MIHNISDIFARYQIRHVTIDSRHVLPSAAFFAIKGHSVNGNDFIEQALAKGALIAITDEASKVVDNERVFYVADIEQALHQALDLLYPLRPEKIIAVTGTNGKSSVVSYVHQILSQLGQSSCALGTLGINCNKMLDQAKYPEYQQIAKAGLTTLDIVSFRAIMHILAEQGVRHVACEASSHGIDQDRIYGIKADAAGFTSFSQDHLDYHGSMERYLAAKLKLFSNYLKDGGAAVIKQDEHYMPAMRSFLEEHAISYSLVGTNTDCDINFQILEHDLDQQKIKLSCSGFEHIFTTGIIGSFQASNLLIAAKLVANIGFDFAEIIEALPEVIAVQGRLQKITVDKEQKPGSPYIFVDYAHTPDALEKSLLELKALMPSSGRLFVIFGCGGDRDKLKRPMMGKVADEIADMVIITDDNPRTEDPAIIRQEIAAAATKAQIITPRDKAIIAAIEQMGSKDALLISGKGHEDYQIIGKQIHHFSDIEVATSALKKKMNIGE
jgi:UDP-N-acetylmuramoyl-L-alanyl-D-glutamate--2,6-diaminopimelate ligase